MSDPFIADPMSFLYLDILCTVLLEDTEDAVEEFNLKMNLIREQESICVENGKKLVSVDQFIGSMKTCIYQTELELQENEAQLVAIERLVSRYEASNLVFLKSPELIPLIPNSYMAFLQLLLSADRSTAQCNSLKEELTVYNNDAIDHLECPNLITQIMDYHLKALNTLENKLDKLQSLSNKCSCDMANIINDECVN
ncbi:uncharacterized protein LOC111604633 isoform X2 [Drosophila hydei]|uniref:Uncharacterized protein LOC111604633 isoform X2 n=1 Tax=Drosophila hydei TaxID=7224 RepID=A0A6J1MB82_DROHY|nr:uncharacterized protein LOC111604633 isoform X2 [Drosophila hydei]